MALLRSFAFVCLMFSSFWVSATPYTLNDIDSQSYAVNGSFTDDWTINLSDLGSVATVSFSSTQLANIFSINGFEVGPSTGQSAYTFDNVASGTIFTVVGEGVGTLGGAYTGAITEISAVPLPAAVWMMGTALVGLVSFGRRKNELAA